jgi:hypothetical protein
MYNVNEIGLFYRDTLTSSLNYKNASLSGSEKAIDPITVLCCSNVLGTDKRKLLAIGIRAKPQCFKGINKDSLPGLYYTNENAWLISDILK